MWEVVVVAGFALGCFYTLLALGFSLIFGVTRIFNLAHGELVVLAGYASYWLWKALSLPFWLTFPAALLTALICCLGLQRLFALIQEPLELNSIVISFGIALILQNLMLSVFSGDYRLIRLPTFAQRLYLLGLPLTWGQALLFGLSLALVTILWLLLRHTYLGKALRATIEDRQAAALAGINVKRMSAYAFAIGALLIGVAGPLYGCIHYLFPTAGVEATLIALTITIFAGMGRVRPLLMGGWILGLAESVTVVLLGASWRELVGAVMLIGILVWRPHGLSAPEER